MFSSLSKLITTNNVRSVLSVPARNSFTVYSSHQNEFQFAFIQPIKVRINHIILVDRFAKVCTFIHVVLDVVFWVGLFVLDEGDNW